MTDSAAIYQVGGLGIGGTLALMASAYLPEDKQFLIERIYLIDSPEPPSYILSNRYYKNIQNRIFTICSNQCLLGHLFTRQVPVITVPNKNSTLFQYDYLGYEIDENYHLIHSATYFSPSVVKFLKILRSDPIILDELIQEIASVETNSFDKDTQLSIVKNIITQHTSNLSSINILTRLFTQVSNLTKYFVS